MTTTASPLNAKNDQMHANSQKQHITQNSSVAAILICILSLTAGALGYRTYSTLTSSNTQTPITESVVPSVTPKNEALQPSPTSIPLHAGIGDYAVSHAKSNGPTIQRVMFDPLDAKKGQPLKLSAVIMSPTDDVIVTGGLTTDSQQIGLTFTKTGTLKDAQVWSTVITLPDDVLYTYVFSVTAVNSQGKTTVRVSPRS